MNNKLIYLVVSTIAIIVLLLPSALSSQAIWVNQGVHKNLSVEIYKPDFDGNSNTTLLTSTTFITLRLPLTENLLFLGELPFAHGEVEFPGSESKTKVGNLYFGFELRPQDFPIFFELGLRVPTLSSSNIATFIGLFSDADRFEAFTPDLINFMGVVNLQHANSSNFFIRLRAGTSVLVNTDGGDDIEWHLLYNGFVGYEKKKFRAEAGFTGRLFFTESGNIGERTFHQLGVNASYLLGRVRPGAHFRIPLDDDLKEFLDFVFGFNLQFYFD